MAIVTKRALGRRQTTRQSSNFISISRALAQSISLSTISFGHHGHHTHHLGHTH